jgi:multidrug resistance efflux pump
MQQTMMDYLIVTAPFNGVITQRNVHPDALVIKMHYLFPNLQLLFQQKENMFWL